MALDEFGCSFDYQFAMNHPWSCCGILQPLFPPHSLSTLFSWLLSLPFCSLFAPFSLTHSNCREMIRCHSCQVRYEHSGLFSLLRYCSASTSPFSTHLPTLPHLFLPLTTSEDILMITISNKGQEMQTERTKTEKEEEECPHVDECLVNCWFSILW